MLSEFYFIFHRKMHLYFTRVLRKLVFNQSVSTEITVFEEHAPT